MDFKSYFQESFAISAQNLQRLSESKEVLEASMKAAQWIVESQLAGGTLFIGGNGGSAADAQHIAAELVGKLDKDRNPLPAMALTTDSSYLTAVGNDYGYDHVFERQVRGLMKPKDIFLAITTSGNSKNILLALEACRKKGVKSILLSGKSGGAAKERNLADLYIVAPGPHTANIQEAHIAIYHALCFAVEKALIEKGHIQYL
jgi:D-sedoheptulose 7-phosphate isomerase